MAGSMVSVATGALGSVLEKLGGACARLTGVRGEVMFLKAELGHVGAFLVRLSQVEDPDEQARCWMAEVRELSYDVEDSVDEFALCVDDGSAQPQLPGFRGFIDRSINLLYSFGTRHRLATEIHRLKDRVREAGERRTRYKIDDGVCSQTTGAVAVDPRLCSRQPNLSHVWGAIQVLRGILSQLSKREYSDTECEDERQLIDNILDFLRDKRYLIVVDDVWSVEKWEIIKCAIPRNNFGSRIITTPHIKGVAKSCSSPHANHVYELRPLSAVHSKGLFLKKIFSSERLPPTPQQNL